MKKPRLSKNPLPTQLMLLSKLLRMLPMLLVKQLTSPWTPQAKPWMRLKVLQQMLPMLPNPLLTPPPKK